MPNWRTTQKSLQVPEGYAAVKCRDCNKVFIIKSDVPISEAVPGHVWCNVNGTMVRHRTRDEDYQAECEEAELCPVCGVPHGPNPYTGCELQTVEARERSKGEERL